MVLVLNLPVPFYLSILVRFISIVEVHDPLVVVLLQVNVITLWSRFTGEIWAMVSVRSLKSDTFYLFCFSSTIHRTTMIKVGRQCKVRALKIDVVFIFLLKATRIRLIIRIRVLISKATAFFWLIMINNLSLRRLLHNQLLISKCCISLHCL